MAPDRLTWITVVYSRGRVKLPSASLEELLAMTRHLEAGAGTVRAFEAAGASAPVQLDGSDVLVLIDVIDEWIREVGKDALPEGVFELRDALYDDVEDNPEAE
jgi:hypothetical protein